MSGLIELKICGRNQLCRIVASDQGETLADCRVGGRTFAVAYTEYEDNAKVDTMGPGSVATIGGTAYCVMEREWGETWEPIP